MKEYEKMTVKELVDELTSLGVTFNKKSRKADLLELLLAETKGKESTEKKTNQRQKQRLNQKRSLLKRFLQMTRVQSLKRAPKKPKQKKKPLFIPVMQ